MAPPPRPAPKPKAPVVARVPKVATPKVVPKAKVVGPKAITLKVVVPKVVNPYIVNPYIVAPQFAIDPSLEDIPVASTSASTSSNGSSFESIDGPNVAPTVRPMVPTKKAKRRTGGEPERSHTKLSKPKAVPRVVRYTVPPRPGPPVLGLQPKASYASTSTGSTLYESRWSVDQQERTYERPGSSTPPPPTRSPPPSSEYPRRPYKIPHRRPTTDSPYGAMYPPQPTNGYTTNGHSNGHSNGSTSYGLTSYGLYSNGASSASSASYASTSLAPLPSVADALLKRTLESDALDESDQNWRDPKRQKTVTSPSSSSSLPKQLGTSPFIVQSAYGSAFTVDPHPSTPLAPARSPVASRTWMETVRAHETISPYSLPQPGLQGHFAPYSASPGASTSGWNDYPAVNFSNGGFDGVMDASTLPLAPALDPAVNGSGSLGFALDPALM